MLFGRAPIAECTLTGEWKLIFDVENGQHPTVLLICFDLFYIVSLIHSLVIRLNYDRCICPSSFD